MGKAALHASQTKKAAACVRRLCRAAFPMDVPTHWTTAHVLAFHLDTILRPFHMVRRRARSSSSRQVLAHLNGPQELAFAVSGSPVHVCDNIKVSAVRFKSIYHKTLLEHKHMHVRSYRWRGNKCPTPRW